MEQTNAGQSLVPAVGASKHALAQIVEPVSGLDLMSLATVMVQSGYFPDTQSVAQGVVKILAGRELGFPAIASLRHIYVDRGHIGVMATLIAGKVRGSGQYDYRILRADEQACEIEFSRRVKGQWRAEGVAGFTLDEAERAGLVRAGSAWASYPADLLFARAISRGQRRFCPDLFGQMVYTPEEVAEIAAQGPTPQTVAPPEPEDLMPRRKPAAGPDAGTVIDRPLAGVVETPPQPTGFEDLYDALGTDEPQERPESRDADGDVPPAGVRAVDSASPLPERAILLAEMDRLCERAKVKAAYFGNLWEKYIGCGVGRDGAPVDAIERLIEAIRKVPVPPEQEELAPAASPAPSAGKLRFTLNGRTVETHGVTKDQLMATFKLAGRVDRRAGPGLAHAVLRKEFGVMSRTELTEEQGERYLIRLREIAEG